MRWIVELRSVNDEDALRQAVEGVGGRLESTATGARALWLPEFEGYEDPDQVWQRATAVRDGLRDLSALDARCEVDLALGPVCGQNLAGTPTRAYFAPLEEGGMTISGAAITCVVHNGAGPSAEARQQMAREAAAREQERQRAAWVKLAARQMAGEPVLKIKELLSHPSPSGQQLGHIVDLIRDACGGDLSRFASEKQISRFERSINHPRVMGLDARHAVSNEQPPPKPMTKHDAKAFAHRIARQWLES